MLGNYYFNEGGDYSVFESNFVYTKNLWNYDHRAISRVVRWVDIDFFESNTIPNQ